MNRVYKSKFCTSTRTVVAVSEVSKNAGKGKKNISKKIMVALALASGISTTAYAGTFTSVINSTGIMGATGTTAGGRTVQCTANETTLDYSCRIATADRGLSVVTNIGSIAMTESALEATIDALNMGLFSVSIGDSSEGSGQQSVAIGWAAKASGLGAIAIGNSKATGEQSIAIGAENNVSGNNSGAIGDPTTITGNNSYSLGNNNNIAQDNTFVLGNTVTTTQANSVVLGNASTDRAATTEASATINGLTYGTFAGQGSAANGVVRVGAEGAERQIINVASGKVSADSTDAINGSQLYAIAANPQKTQFLKCQAQAHFTKNSD